MGTICPDTIYLTSSPRVRFYRDEAFGHFDAYLTSSHEKYVEERILDWLKTDVFPRGDMNLDGVVDCRDIAVVRASFGKKRGDKGSDARADVNNDNIVDIRDLIRLATAASRDDVSLRLGLTTPLGTAAFSRIRFAWRIYPGTMWRFRCEVFS